ncbi:MAG: hypothetical protein KatS3mg010_0877 [Acidimicrobiia bacterium]|nr:MAG: hypothetical protein KatS3mg010_0877 [Acidimicrobiia bacterium]
MPGGEERGSVAGFPLRDQHRRVEDTPPQGSRRVGDLRQRSGGLGPERRGGARHARAVVCTPEPIEELRTMIHASVSASPASRCGVDDAGAVPGVTSPPVIGEGDRLPDVTLVDHEGRPWQPAHHRGRTLVLVLHRHLA